MGERNGSQTDPPVPGRVLERNADPVLGAPARWLPYPDYGSMYSRNRTGEKSPDRLQEPGIGPQPTLETESRASFFGNSGNDPVSTKVAGYPRYESPTDSDRTRPRVQAVARAVSPRSHKRETMSEIARNHGKSTGYCNHSDIRDTDRDVPHCDGCGLTIGRVREVEVENPDGRITVCENCEDSLRATIAEVIRVYE